MQDMQRFMLEKKKIIRRKLRKPAESGASDAAVVDHKDEDADLPKSKYNILNSMESSYNRMEDEVKQVLLLCGVLGPSISVSNLLKYVIGLGVFKNLNSIDAARSRLDRIIGDLEKPLLLHYSAREIKVPALICDVASSIASRHYNVFTRNDPLNDWPGEGVLANCTQIILKRCNIQTLPQRLDCPVLDFLYLDTNDNPTLEIPHSFFEGMGNLRVLVFIGVTMPSLPASLVFLKKLKTLCLNECRLQDMVGIGALKSLEILSFFRSSMKEFPSEIEQLTRLSALELQIPEASIPPSSMIFEKLDEYNIVIGDRSEWSDSNGTSRFLKLKLHPNIHLEPEIKAIVVSAQDLYLEIDGLEQIWPDPLTVDQVFEKLKAIKVNSCDRLECLFLASTIKKFSKLVEIEVSKCSSMKNIVLLDSGTTIDDIESIPVRSLTLQHLPHMDGFCCNDLPHHIPTLFPNEKALFRHLKHLKLICISRIILLVITTLSNGMVPLQNLETMEIEDCYHLQYLFVIKGVNMHENYGELLPHLCKLHLRNLGEFRSIVGLNHPGGTLSFKMLKHLTVCNCNQLRYVLPLYVVENLQQLENIEISKCKMLERVFGDEEDTQMRESKETRTTNTVQLPQVKSLILEKLPNFTACYKDGCIVEWLSLKTVRVFECPRIQKSSLGRIHRPLLTSERNEGNTRSNNENPEINAENFFLFTDELSKIDKLEINDSEELKKRMEMKLWPSSYSKLTTLVARQCHEDLSKFLYKLSSQLHELQKLTVENCELLDKVFDLGDLAPNEQGPHLFPKLQTMRLHVLPNLKRIWSKNPSKIVELGKLVKLEIIKCGLREIPLSIALVEQLVSLKELTIESCKEIEKVFIEDVTEVQEISFRNLEYLKLASLPKLISFNPGHCNFKFPSLLRLWIEKCPELNTFTTGFLSNQTLPKEMMVCPKLQTLKLADLKAVEVDSLRKLEKLETLVVRNCSSLRHLALHSLCLKLKEIEISGCNILGDISTDRKKGKTEEKAFHCLKSIVLENLPELSFFSLETCEFPALIKLRIVNCPTHVKLPWNVSAKADNSLNKNSAFVLFDNIMEDSSRGEGKMKIAHTLKSLELSHLPKMQLWKQEPRIEVFENLESLKIIGCGSMEKLFSISVAQHLSSLKFLTLYKCENMVQVLGGGGGNSGRVFQKLETLVLKHLPKLKSFCEEDVDFGEFPELSMVRVEHVPNMNRFVKKSLIKTPKLKQVHVTPITKCWHQNLDKTIAFLHYNHKKLEEEVWESDQRSTAPHTDAAESSSRAPILTDSSLLIKEAETELH